MHKINSKSKIKNSKFNFRYLTFLLGICFEFYALCFGFNQNAYASNTENIKKNFLQGDYKACIQEGEKILVNSRNHRKNKDEFYYLLGLSYLKEGNYLRSSNTFEIILNEFRNSRFKEEAKIGLGDSYFLKGDYSLASVQYKELLNNNPRTKLRPGVYYRLNQIGLKTGNKEQQAEFLAKLKKEFPLSAEARMDKELFPLNTQIQMEKKPILSDPTLSYAVQVGAFSSKTNAENLAEKLRNKGYITFVSESLSENNKIYKVRVGSFNNRSEAKELERELKKQGYPTKIIP